MSGTAFIDLGESWSVVEERPARSRQPPARRAQLAALLLVVVLLLAGGSAATTSPLTPLATIDVSGISFTEVGGGGVFLVAGTGTAGFVARYAQDTGAMTWKLAVPDRPDALAYLPAARVVTAWYYGREGPNRVTVLDAATGARLWELSGGLYPPPTADAERTLTVPGDPNTPTQARYTDLRTGRAIWTRPVPAGAQIVDTDPGTPASAAGWVVSAPDGTLTLLARDTGAVLGSTKVDRLVPADTAMVGPEDIAIVNVIGGRLFVTRRIGTPDGEVASYDLPGLTLRWVHSGLSAGYPSSCGPNLCLWGVTGGTTALDPVTGATRWTNKVWQAADDLGGGRLLAFRDGNAEHGGVLDATTGRLLGDLGNWTVLLGSDNYLASQPARDDVRSSWIGVVDPGRAVVRPVDMLAGPSTGGCITGGDLLVCRTVDAKVRVWRYHPGDRDRPQ